MLNEPVGHAPERDPVGVPRGSRVHGARAPARVARVMACAVAVIAGAAVVPVAQAPVELRPAAAEAQRAFRDMRFGLFIHWGVYSLLGSGEWVMENQRIPAAVYEKLPGSFNPTQHRHATRSTR